MPPQAPRPEAPAAAPPPTQGPPPPLAPGMAQSPPPGPPSWSMPPPVPPASAPWWRRPVALIAAAVVLVAAVAGIALATSNHSPSGSSRTAVGPAPPPAPTDAPSTEPGSTTTAGQQDNGPFITAADAICAKYLPGINEAGSAGDTAQVLNLFEAELAQLDNLGEPPRDQATFDESLSYAEDVVSDLQTGDLAAANTAAVQADTFAGQFGLKVCNNGH
jgi:hypothetical protein